MKSNLIAPNSCMSSGNLLKNSDIAPRIIEIHLNPPRLTLDHSKMPGLVADENNKYLFFFYDA